MVINKCHLPIGARLLGSADNLYNHSPLNLHYCCTNHFKLARCLYISEEWGLNLKPLIESHARTIESLAACSSFNALYIL